VWVLTSVMTGNLARRRFAADHPARVRGWRHRIDLGFEEVPVVSRPLIREG
jgi:hypothetical protein